MTELAYREVGDGAIPVLILHGWLTDSRAFQRLFPYLDKRRFTYCLVDARGCGDSRDVVGCFSIEEIASDTLMLADRLGWTTFHLVGHSMGGMAAQLISAVAPKRVRRLVAITPAPSQVVSVDSATKAAFAAAATDEHARYAFVDQLTGHELHPQEVRAIAAFAADGVAAAHLGYLDSFTHLDFHRSIVGEAREIAVLALAGARDPVCTAQALSETLLRAWPRSCLKVLGACGHFPMFEAPQALATCIERFIVEC